MRAAFELEVGFEKLPNSGSVMQETGWAPILPKLGRDLLKVQEMQHCPNWAEKNIYMTKIIP